MTPHEISPPSGVQSAKEVSGSTTGMVASKVESPPCNHPGGPVASEPVAIIGMAMRLPGGIHNSEDLWDFLSHKKSGLCDVPQNRFNINGFYDPSGNYGTIPVNKAYFLEDVELQQFDTSVFPIPKSELERLDPTQRQLLQVAYECLENAGVASWRGSNIGCYVGEFGEDWADISARETQNRGNYRYTGLADFALPNRLSYELDLHGPSMAIKTACSSSLVGLDLACKAIQSGECDSALVGGVSLIFSPATYISVNDLGVISPNGQCRSFDAGADGYARGEAVNMILVKRLDHALRDKDPIRAIIRGTGVNVDGKTNGMLTPNATAQADLIRQTYEAAGIKDISQTAIVECHGTGTPVGDPIETEAVGNCFGDNGVIITSIKPNLGHSEAAAGMTSLIKCVLALEHRKVLPNINFDIPNPNIPFKKFNLHVPTEVEAWPKGRAERVSVNSFGIGGVNAHVILESAHQFGIDLEGKHNTSKPTHGKLSNGGAANGTGANGTYTNGNHVNGFDKQAKPSVLLFSAYNPESLKAQVSAYREYIASHKPLLRDLAYTLANRRDHKPYRTYVVTDDLSTSEDVSEIQVTEQLTPPIAWIFTGQGAQWAEMGAELIDTNVTFRGTIRKLDKYIQTLQLPFPLSIEDELRKDKHTSCVYRADVGHPLCVALQIALVDVLKSWGVVPDIALGHSSGETAAAYACGALTAEAAIFTATRRGISNVSSDRRGSMAAVGLGRDEIQPYLVLGVDIACENSQSNVTLSGDTKGVEQVIETIKAERPGVFARLIRVEKAFHSHHMRDYGPSYEEQLKPVVRSGEPKIPFYSSVTGGRLTGQGKLEAAYWRANMESPVLFNSAFRAALHDEARKMVLIEIGPHPALAGPMGQILRDLGRTDVHICTLVRGKSCQDSLLNLAGKLYQHSVPVELSVICPPGEFVRDLPRYSWKQDISHWEESRIARGWRFRENPPHELLGNRVVETECDPCWRKVLAVEDALWLTGHEVNGHVVFPAAGYIAMVGEALRQLSGETTYILRNVRIASALVLEMDKVTELVTSLKATTADASDSSPWYEFTISSFNGTGWVKNCYGEAMEITKKPFYNDIDIPHTDCFPRKLDKKNAYDILKRVGFNYTGLFEGMESISVSTTSIEAKASVATRIQGAAAVGGKCSTYSLHPVAIDQCFQLFTIAACRGLWRNTGQLAVPTFIEEVVISPSVLDMDVTAKINSLDELGVWTGDLIAQGADTPVLTIKGMKSTVLISSPIEDQVPLITQLEWRPHSDFVDLVPGLHPHEPRRKEWPLLEELITLCSFDHLEQVKNTDTTPAHLLKLLNWMQRHTEQYLSGLNGWLAKERNLQDLNREQRVARIDEIVGELSDSIDVAFATAIHRLFVEAPDIFAGEVHPLHILLPDNILSRFYDATSFDWANTIQVVANTNPHLRVLEVGAGTGGMTARVLRVLTSPYGERLYSHYSYTDISAGFLAAARERFASAESMEYIVLDISKDPAEQGFQLGSYDLIIASNVLHATPCLNTTLRNVKSLLRPSGRLFLEELCPDSMFVNYVMGFFPGWWLGAYDNRVEQPWVSPERWTEELVAAGFQKPDVTALDSVAPYHLSAGIIVSRESRRTTPSRVAILCHTPDGPYVAEMRRCLDALGIAVDISLFGQALLDCDTISLLDMQDPTLHDMSQEGFKNMMKYLQSHTEKIIWVTNASQVGCEDPRAAMILGLARTARNEYSREIFTVEVDPAMTPENTTKAISDIFCSVNTVGMNPESLNYDYEYAIVDGEILVSRFHWQTPSLALSEINLEDYHDGARKYLTMTTPGLLHTMKWCNGRIKDPLEDEVLVETKAVGLNFRDVVLALGIVQGAPSGMGHEGSGIVRAVGPGVQRFSVGDRVMYISDGCFTTHLTLREALCAKLDSSMGFVEGASLPAVYATALMALVDTSHLQKGQSILIHAACGGVGLAAIQIAQMIGAEIYCTAGSEAKRKYLTEHCGIEARYIFNSRDDSFLSKVMRATNKRGVDVVLNSLSGDLLHASWKCVAEFGMMIEIGKRDFQRRAKLAMEIFEANRAFVGLDIRGLSQSRPERAMDLVRRCIELIGLGHIAGPTVSTTFAAADIQEAYRTMQAAKHIGKIVIEMPNDPLELGPKQQDKSAIGYSESKPTPVFRPDRSYLLVGGLGGLGRAVATWMVEHGAQVLVFLSRSAQERPEIQGFLEDVRSQGCQVLLVAGSVSNMDDVQRAVDTATAVQPVAGIINLSMVLRDVMLSKMSFSDWTEAVEPKVKGTWNLHHVTAKSPLDFFILFSSQNGQIGQVGQANYAAANTFLDAFVQYRHRNGLVASVIDVGLMGDVGFAAENRAILKTLSRTGMYILQEQDMLDAITLALKRSRPALPSSDKHMYQSPGHMGIGLNTTIPISSPSTRVSWKRDARMSIYHNLEKSAGAFNNDDSSRTDTLKTLLAAEQPEEKKTDVIAKALARTLANFLIKDESSFPFDRPLKNLGMDSLIAMEVRNWIRQQTNVEVSTFTILQSPSLIHLGHNVREAMAGTDES